MITSQTKSPLKPDCLITDLKMRLSVNSDLQNESNHIQLLRLTPVHVKTEWWMLEWSMNDKAIRLAMIIETILITNLDYFDGERNALFEDILS